MGYCQRPCAGDIPLSLYWKRKKNARNARNETGGKKKRLALKKKSNERGQRLRAARKQCHIERGKKGHKKGEIRWGTGQKAEAAESRDQRGGARTCS